MLTKYKLSKYNTEVNSADGVLLHNQISHALICLKPKEYLALQKFKITGHGLSFLFKRLLKQGGYLIPTDFDELGFIKNSYIYKLDNTEFKSLTIAPTDRCNLKCVYCFEGKNQWVVMSQETIEKLKVFIQEFLTATPTKHFAICWFGGEPTLATKEMLQLSEWAMSFCNNRSIKYSNSMITNGTLLKDNMIDVLRSMNCFDLQITLDGDQEQHDKQRPYRVSLPVLNNPKIIPHSSFNAIIGNLPMLYEHGFRINLRVNVGKNNKDSITKIQSLLEKMGIDKNHTSGGRIKIYAGHLFDSEMSLSKEEWAPFGLIKSLNPFMGGGCLATAKFAFGVSQNGKLCKCWEHITDEIHTIGTIDDLLYAREGYGLHEQFDPVTDPICSKCHVLPICYGGCYAHNDFFKGRDGVKDIGCIAEKWLLNQYILNLYHENKPSTPPKSSIVDLLFGCG